MIKKSILVVACLLSITLFALILVTNFAHADTVEWARVVKDNVYLYYSADLDQQLFVLEKSYYVQITQTFDSVLEVEVIPSNDADFQTVVGYVRRSDVSLCATAPTEPYYPTVKVSVIEDSVDLKLSAVPSSKTIHSVVNTQQVCYYGKRENYGITWYYVRHAGKFGYVEASAVSLPQVSLHPTPLPQTPANTTPSKPSNPSDPTDVTPTESASPASEILLIVFVVVLAVGLMLALFLPGNLKKRDNIFEQDI